MNPLNLSPKEIKKIESGLKQRHIDLMSASWELVPTKGSSKSFIIHPTDGKISIVKVEGEIQCSAKTLFDYLVTNFDKTCSEWNDVMLFSEMKKKYSDSIKILRLVSEGHVVADREDVFIQCTGKFENGNIYEVSKGFDESLIPIDTSISKYTVRGIMYFASKEIIPISNNKCLYKVIWHYDPGGWLGRLIPKKTLGKMVLKNLAHEYQKLINIFPKK